MHVHFIPGRCPTECIRFLRGFHQQGLLQVSTFHFVYPLTRCQMKLCKCMRRHVQHGAQLAHTRANSAGSDTTAYAPAAIRQTKRRRSRDTAGPRHTARPRQTQPTRGCASVCYRSAHCIALRCVPLPMHGLALHFGNLSWRPVHSAALMVCVPRRVIRMCTAMRCGAEKLHI